MPVLRYDFVLKLAPKICHFCIRFMYNSYWSQCIISTYFEHSEQFMTQTDPLNSNEPPHDKTNKMTFAPNEDSDQSLLCAQWVAKDSMFLPADSKDSDQTGRMPRLIWIFAGCTGHFVGFVMRPLKCLVLLQESSWTQLIKPFLKSG